MEAQNARKKITNVLTQKTKAKGDKRRTRRLPDVRFAPILLKKSFWGDERKFSEPLMRFVRGDVRFFGLFDFGLLQQYPPIADIAYPLAVVTTSEQSPFFR